MESIRRAIRRNIEHFRKQQGLTQKELSRKANYSASYVGKIERGEVDVSLEAMLRLSDALHCSPDDLILRHEDLEQSLPPHGRDFLSSNPVFDYAFQHVEHIVGVTDSSGQTMLINQAFSKYYERSPEQVFGTNLWKLPFWKLSDEAQQQLSDAVLQTSEEPGSSFYELESRGGKASHLVLSHLEENGHANRYIVFELLWPIAFTKGETLEVRGLNQASQW